MIDEWGGVGKEKVMMARVGYVCSSFVDNELMGSMTETCTCHHFSRLQCTSNLPFPLIHYWSITVIPSSTFTSPPYK